MAKAILRIDLNAIAENWITLKTLARPQATTSAVVKADGYGLGIARVAQTLHQTGVTKFFVATAEEGSVLRQHVAGNFSIYILSGYMKGDRDHLKDNELIPVILSKEQFERFVQDFDSWPFGLQLDTGMNRLGMEEEHFSDLKEPICRRRPHFIMSHLACAEETDSDMNSLQLANFVRLTAGIPCPLSLVATAGMFLGPDYQFDLCRPGIGLYGGFPFTGVKPVVNVLIPLIQIQDVAPQEGVGYDMSWIATEPTRVATIAAGYADGLLRSLSSNSFVYANGAPCPVIGRVSMDLITVDISSVKEIPDHFEILGADQTVAELARHASTIPHEILTSLGQRYHRVYLEDPTGDSG